MIGTFCLRLALGMLGALLLSPKQMHPRFFRTHFLTVLGLCLVAAILGWPSNVSATLLVATVGAFAGAIVWTFEKTIAGWMCLATTALSIAVSFALAQEPTLLWIRLTDDVTAAALLGFAITAMLVGHSYLISPGFTIRPLMWQLAALGIALLLRIGIAAT